MVAPSRNNASVCRVDMVVPFPLACSLCGAYTTLPGLSPLSIQYWVMAVHFLSAHKDQAKEEEG